MNTSSLFDLSVGGFLRGYESYIVTEAVILSAIRRVTKETSLNIREAFKSYCYTSEKCAVCEEAYEDLVNGDANKIALNYKDVTFCSKRCLLNGWIDILNSLKDRLSVSKHR